MLGLSGGKILLGLTKAVVAARVQDLQWCLHLRSFGKLASFSKQAGSRVILVQLMIVLHSLGELIM